jgi:sugar phosphate isomerase/epimerase
MWHISAFADEISDDVDEQCRVLDSLGIENMVLRSAWGTNVVDLDDAAIERVAEVLVRHGISVSCVGSPSGKVYLDEDFALHLAKFKRALAVARRLGAPQVRIFSFFIHPEEQVDDCADAVIARLVEMARLAEEAGVVLVHENEKDIYGDSPARCRHLLESVNSPFLRATWDPANFVQTGHAPFTDGYELLRPYIVDVQIKDAEADSGRVVPAGEGAGQIEETIQALKGDGYQGAIVLEPHLGHGHRLGGFSGPELFTHAWESLKEILVRNEVAFT